MTENDVSAASMDALPPIASAHVRTSASPSPACVLDFVRAGSARQNGSCACAAASGSRG